MNRTARYSIFAGAAVLLLLLAALVVLQIRQPASQDARASTEQPQNTEHAAGGLAAADLDGDGTVYQSGMHPWIVEDAPGQCPICGMDLVPVRVGEQSDGLIRIDPVTLQNIGVRTAPVSIEQMHVMVRTTGRFEADERRIVAVSPKVSGWIERLHVNYEGARVSRGQPLLEIYSPDLVTTQEEYLLALRSQQRLDGTAAADDALRLVEAARRRLSYWDISDEQIRRLEETQTPQKTLVLYAPANGTVVGTSVVEGQKVNAGETLMQLSDLSTIWMIVDLYEQNLAWIDIGTEAQIEMPYQPGTVTTGRIDYIYDVLSPDTRSVRARIPVPNPALKLKPGMYATVTLTGGHAEPTPVVPSEAVVRSGGNDLVILSLGDGQFYPTDVVTGVESGGRVQILSGLAGDETVVTSAQFLIDSEARLQSAVAAMLSDGTSRPTGDEAPPAHLPDPHAGH